MTAAKTGLSSTRRCVFCFSSRRRGRFGAASAQTGLLVYAPLRFLLLVEAPRPFSETPAGKTALSPARRARADFVIHRLVTHDVAFIKPLKFSVFQNCVLVQVPWPFCRSRPRRRGRFRLSDPAARRQNCVFAWGVFTFFFGPLSRVILGFHGKCHLQNLSLLPVKAPCSFPSRSAPKTALSPTRRCVFCFPLRRRDHFSATRPKTGRLAYAPLRFVLLAKAPWPLFGDGRKNGLLACAPLRFVLLAKAPWPFWRREAPGGPETALSPARRAPLILSRQPS